MQPSRRWLSTNGSIIASARARSRIQRSDMIDMKYLTPDVQHADQREQPPRGIEIDLDLVVETLLEHLGAVVVQASPRHVDGFDLGRCRTANRLVVTIADREIISDRTAERGEREHDGVERCFVFMAD